MENIFAVLSIAFQLSGAVLLTIRFWGKRKNEILQQYFNSSEIICRDDGEEVVLRKEKLQKIFKEIYLTRFSFIYIVIGYVLSIFDMSISKCCAILIILFVTLLLILLAHFFAFSYVKSNILKIKKFLMMKLWKEGMLFKRLQIRRLKISLTP